MPANPDDLAMSFDTPNGAHVEIYDTYCKTFTPEDKDRADAKFNEILYRAEMRKMMAARGLGSSQGHG